MKTLRIIIFSLLPTALISMSAVGDDSIPRMSAERADSLLKTLSVSHGKATVHKTDPIPTDTALITDTVSVIPDDTAQTTDAAQIAVTVQATDTVQATTVPKPETVRKKTYADRNRLLSQPDKNVIGQPDNGSVDYNDIRSVNEATLIGGGGYRMRDKYLSELDYGGVGLRFTNERMRITKLAGGYRASRQNMVTVDISSTINGAENANLLSAFANYSIGYHYRFLPDPFFKIMVGGSLHGMLGMVYNTRNGNNPMTVHADVDLNLSIIGIYEFRIKKHSLAIRYQLETPFAGMLFSPVYNQSYYEIFSLGNTAEIFNFNSFHNKFAVNNYLTLDFPVGVVTMRVGYLGCYYSTYVHSIDRYVISNNVMLGVVKEFAAFGGREMRRRNLFHSAYY